MYTQGFEQAWIATIAFVPHLILAVIIGVIGYLVARFVGSAIQKVLHRSGFDRMVERGGVKQAMARSGYDVSDVIGKVAFWFVMLFVLQMAFGVFGPNPISDLITRMIAFLPNIFVAGLIIVITAAIATGVKDILQASLGGMSYGRAVAIGASIAILTVGVFAALNQLMVAPAIVNGLFYAILAVIAGSAIVAIGGGGIVPMQGVWRSGLANVQNQTPHIASAMETAPERMQHREQESAGVAAEPLMPEPAPMGLNYSQNEETRQPL